MLSISRPTSAGIPFYTNDCNRDGLIAHTHQSVIKRQKNLQLYSHNNNTILIKWHEAFSKPSDRQTLSIYSAHTRAFCPKTPSTPLDPDPRIERRC
jgi:hypothetical protein